MMSDERRRRQWSPPPPKESRRDAGIVISIIMIACSNRGTGPAAPDGYGPLRAYAASKGLWKRNLPQGKRYLGFHNPCATVSMKAVLW